MNNIRYRMPLVEEATALVVPSGFDMRARMRLLLNVEDAEELVDDCHINKFENFTLREREREQHLSLYIVQSMNPIPQTNMNAKNQYQDLV